MIKAVYIKEIKEGLVKIISIPDIEQVCVGREVGYALVEVPTDITIISGKEIRNSMGAQENWLPSEVKELIKVWKQHG